MSKAGERILASIREARAFARGETNKGFRVHVPDKVDVRAIRKKLNLSRAAFALRFGFEPTAVKEWEIGRRRPNQSARVLLKVIQHEPEAVERALAVPKRTKRRQLEPARTGRGRRARKVQRTADVTFEV